MSTTEDVQMRIQHLRKLLNRANVVEDVTKQHVMEQLRLLEEKVCNKPVSLADAGGARLVQFEDRTTTNGDESNIEFDDDLRKAWDEMCWQTRNDMSGEEMLLVTEKTMKTLTQAYRVANQDKVMQYWRFLVNRRQEAVRTIAACDPNDNSPKERNAGAIVASTAKASQRTEAIPDGIKQYDYTPDVASPTAAMWQKETIRPENLGTPRGSLRGGSSVRGGTSRSGASRMGDVKSRQARTIKSSDSFVNPTGWSK